MATINDFDRFFLNLPPFDREDNFEEYWDNSLRTLKQIPIEPKYEHAKKSSHPGFNTYNITYRSYNKAIVMGQLLIPDGVDRPKVVIVLGDYNQPMPYRGFPLDKTVAYFFLRLRGHELLLFDRNQGEEKPPSPGYMAENLIDRENFYVKGIYLDAYRAIDMLRLKNLVDCSAVGYIGKGLGAAAALFAASHSSRVRALVLDTPAFVYLNMSQNLSTGDTANEINAFLAHHKIKNKAIKKNLTYFDALNFSDAISCPCLVTLGFKDNISPPECIFALFNHLICDKTIEVYPDEGNEAGGEKQFRKSVKWISEILNRD